MKAILVMVLLLSACGNTSPSPPPSPPLLEKVEIVDAVARGAVCNDGSPAAYYFQKGQGAGVQDWVIHLQGGGRCKNLTECRAKSSRGWEGSILGDGILSDVYGNNAHFYQSNHVYLRQCSSDGWTGTRKVGLGVKRRYFKGSTIFKRVIRDLINNADLKRAQRVLFSGASSGTQGVLQHLDWLAALLPQATVKGVIDAGYYIDVPRYDLTLDSVAVSMQNYMNLHGSVFDAGCLSAYASNPSYCMLPQAVIPYITTPLLIKQSQRDPVILALYGVARPYDNSELAYIDNYVLSLKASLMSQPLVYAAASARHTTIARLRFPLEKIGQTYFSDFLGGWFYQSAQPASIIE